MTEKDYKEVETPIHVNGVGKYIVRLEGCLEPDITGPYSSEDERDADVKRIHSTMDDYDALFALDIDLTIENGTFKLVPTAWCWSGGFFEESEG